MEGRGLDIIVTTKVVPCENNPCQAQEHPSLEELLANEGVTLIREDVCRVLIGVTILLMLVELLRESLRQEKAHEAYKRGILIYNFREVSRDLRRDNRDPPLLQHLSRMDAQHI